MGHGVRQYRIEADVERRSAPGHSRARACRRREATAWAARAYRPSVTTEPPQPRAIARGLARSHSITILSCPELLRLSLDTDKGTTEVLSICGRGHFRASWVKPSPAELPRSVNEDHGGSGQQQLQIAHRGSGGNAVNSLSVAVMMRRKR